MHTKRAMVVVLISIMLTLAIVHFVYADARALNISETYVKADRHIPTGANSSGNPPATSPFEDDGTDASSNVHVISSGFVQTNTTPSGSSSQTTSSGNLQCGAIDSMKERLRCRLKQGNEADFVPEQCRGLQGSQKIKCQSNYDLSKGCFDKSSDNDRVTCARAQFIISNIANERAQCETSNDKTSCVTDLKSRVDALVLFRFDELVWKAKQLNVKGTVSEDATVSFINDVELKKQAYASASTTTDKKAVVSDVQGLWKSFISSVKL